MDRAKPRLRNKTHRFAMTFADSRPFLLTNMASLETLNAQIPTPVPMDRFRPNIVVSGASSFIEDEKEIRSIGSVEFIENVDCERCSITTVDQLSGEKTGPEPLRVLAKTRRSPNGVVFGRRLVHSGPGKLRIGDRVSFS